LVSIDNLLSKVVDVKQFVNRSLIFIIFVWLGSVSCLPFRIQKFKSLLLETLVQRYHMGKILDIVGYTRLGIQVILV
jgi:hypothetical protein